MEARIGDTVRVAGQEGVWRVEEYRGAPSGQGYALRRDIEETGASLTYTCSAEEIEEIVGARKAGAKGAAGSEPPPADGPQDAVRGRLDFSGWHPTQRHRRGGPPEAA